MSNSIGNLKNSGLQGNNFPWQLKVLQGLQAIANSTSAPLTCVDQVTVCGTTFTDIEGVSALNVNVVNPIPLEVVINEANDSILVYGNDGTTNRKIKTDINGELQVDVLTMPATFAEDSAHVSGNTGAFVMGVRNDLNTPMTNANGDYSPIAVNNNGAVAIQDGGNSITVDATALDIRPLTCADKVSLCFNDGVSDLTVSTANPLPVNAAITFPSSLPVTQDPLSNPWTVDGRVSIGDGTDLLEINTDGSINVNATIDCDTSSIKICDGTTDLGINLDGSINTQSSTLDGSGNAITSLLSGSRRGLDVNILTPTVAVALGSLVETGVAGDLSSFGPSITSISFQNIGTTVATISVDGGANFFPLAPGTSLNLDPRIPMGYYDGTSFFWDATAIGASLLIIYNYI
jgi:hypothetical protein